MRILSITLLAVLATPCLAQELEPSYIALNRLKRIEYGSYRPQAIAIASADREVHRVSISVFLATELRDGTDGHAPVWVLRREVTNDSGAEVSWTDDRSCPQIFVALDALQLVAFPNLRLQGFPEPVRRPGTNTLPPVIPPMHSDEHLIWGYGRTEDNRRVEVALTSRGGGAAAWSESAASSLAPCWRSEEPALS